MALVGIEAVTGKRSGQNSPAGNETRERRLAKAPTDARETQLRHAPAATPDWLMMGLGLGIAVGAVFVELMHLPDAFLFVLAGLGVVLYASLSRRFEQPDAGPAENRGTQQLERLAHKLDEGIESLRDVQWEMRDSEMRYRDLLDNQVDIIMRRDRRGRISFVNHAFCTTFGADPDSIIGTRFEPQLVGGDALPAVDDKRIGDRHSYECELMTRQGRRWFLFEDLVLRDEKQAPREIHTLGRDVTDEKQAAKALKEARDQAEAANRAKTRFLATMSHEIRTPMNGIMGMTDLLAESELSPDQRTYCRAIGKSATTLLSLIDEILDFSKIEAGKFEVSLAPYDPTELAEGVVELLAPRAFEKGLSMGCFVSPDLPQQVVGDEARMRQILLNLVGNAIKFTESGGVTLEISAAGEKDGLLRFAVADTGVGLTREDMERIFVEFEQIDDSSTRRNGGTGLGLAITRRLVERLDGNIKVASSRTKGSTFTVDVPLQPVTGAAISGERLVAPSGVSRVLIACDHEIEGRLVGKMLKSVGIDVVVQDRRMALEMLQDGAGAGFDAVITDAIEAPLFAADLLHAAEKHAHHPVRGLLMIETTDRRDYEMMRERGFDAYITRPVRHVSVLKRLAAAVGRSVIAAPEVGQLDFQPAKVAKPLHSAVEPEAPKTLTAETLTVPATVAAKKARVLLAEDNEINALLGCRLLEHMGYEVDHVTDGLLAVRAIQKAKQGHTYDLVLMDIHMPHMDGLTATQEIRAYERENMSEGAHVPIVALTANAFSEVRKECYEAGMDAYLAKPFAREELIETIESCLRPAVAVAS